MKTHFTSDAAPTRTSIPWCQGNPKPGWQVTNDRAEVTCATCLKAAGAKPAPTLRDLAAEIADRTDCDTFKTGGEGYVG